MLAWGRERQIAAGVRLRQEAALQTALQSWIQRMQPVTVEEGGAVLALRKTAAPGSAVDGVYGTCAMNK
jgi:hypothetical protein